MKSCFEICPHCGHTDAHYIHRRRGFGGTQYKCRMCMRYFTISGEDDAPRRTPLNTEDNTAEIISPVTRGAPPTAESVMARFDLDPDVWEIERQTVNTWETTFKGNPVPLYQLKLWLVRKVPVARWPELRGAKLYAFDEDMPLVDTESRNKKLVFVVPDAQVGFRRTSTGELEPLHDVRAMALMADLINTYTPDEVVMLGDMLDLPDWSDKFLTSPDFRNQTQPALDYLANWIALWRKSTHRAVLIEGNHEKRLRDAVVKHVPAMYGLTRALSGQDAPPTYSIPYLLGLDELRVEWIGDYPRGEYWINDRLRCTHAQKLGNRGGMTVAKSLIGARCSTIYGHAHRLEAAHVTVRERHGARVYGSYCAGTLARIDGVVPSNTAEEDWQQGWVSVTSLGNDFQVHLHNIYDGKCVYSGRLWEAEENE